MHILRARFGTPREFETYFQDDLPNKGLFCPTTTRLKVGEPVIVELMMRDLPNKVLIRSVVRAYRSSVPRLRVRAGATVEFEADESEKVKFVLEALASRRKPERRRKHSRLPLVVPVRYKIDSELDFQASVMSEISIGGAMLGTSTPLPLDSDVIVEITLPGAVKAMNISGKVSYHLPNGGSGIKFLSRDAAGLRRLREFVRRIAEG